MTDGQFETQETAAVSLRFDLERENEALKARIGELEAAQKPRPIETAPRDGTRILVEVHDPDAPSSRAWGWCVAVWSEGFSEEDSYPDDPVWGWWRDDDMDEFISPTRWLPMPPPPEVTP